MNQSFTPDLRCSSCFKGQQHSARIHEKNLERAVQEEKEIARQVSEMLKQTVPEKTR